MVVIPLGCIAICAILIALAPASQVLPQLPVCVYTQTSDFDHPRSTNIARDLCNRNLPFSRDRVVVATTTRNCVGKLRNTPYTYQVNISTYTVAVHCQFVCDCSLVGHMKGEDKPSKITRIPLGEWQLKFPSKRDCF